MVTASSDAHDGHDADDAHPGHDEHESDAGRVVVPWERLSPQALRGVIEEFVSREGTEYGLTEVELEVKVTSVRRQLERRAVFVVFDGATSTVNLVTAEALADGER